MIDPSKVFKKYIFKGAVQRYKQDEYVKEGEYYRVYGRIEKEDKRYYPFIYGQCGRDFYQLLPIEDWIIKEIFGTTERKKIPSDWAAKAKEILKHYGHVYKLHDWQLKFLRGIYVLLANDYGYRGGLIVPLGGGKTLVTLILSQLGKSLYICPKHLRGTIEREAEKWGLNLPTITTPESCKKLEADYEVVILDECLSCKNPKSKRSKEVTRIMSTAYIKIAMTGTPLSAKQGLDARWLRTLGTIVPEDESTWKWRFGINPEYRQVTTKHSYTPLMVDGWKINELANYVKPYIYIVDIKEINKEIPNARYEKVYLSKPKFYNQILKGLLTKNNKQKARTQARASTSGFVYNDSKGVIWLNKSIPEKIQWVIDFINNNPNEPVVVFSNWHPEQDKLREVFIKKNIKFNEVTQTVKQTRDFENGQTNVLLCSASLTEGMNLQRSRVAIFLSNSTNPTKRQQAEGRLYRQGQKRSVVFYDLLCKDTLDEAALDLLKEHRDMSEKFIEKQLELVLEKQMKEV